MEEGGCKKGFTASRMVYMYKLGSLLLYTFEFNCTMSYIHTCMHKYKYVCTQFDTRDKLVALYTIMCYFSIKNVATFVCVVHNTIYYKPTSIFKQHSN